MGTAPSQTLPSTSVSVHYVYSFMALYIRLFLTLTFTVPVFFTTNLLKMNLLAWNCGQTFQKRF